MSSHSKYPKAIPLRSPEELAATGNRPAPLPDKRLKESHAELEQRAQSLRRWVLRLSLACALLTLSASTAAWYAFKPPVALSTQHPALSTEHSALSTHEQARPFKEIAIAAPTQRSFVASQRTPTDAPATTQKGVLLEALGSLSVTHLYQSHLNIGLLADGVESETYSVDEAEANLKSVIEMMKHVDNQLGKLVKTGLDQEDQDSIREIQAVSGMLNLQIESLRSYWASDDAAHASQYHVARKATWQGLSKVLGLDK
jgi:hypothetical protein